MILSEIIKSGLVASTRQEIATRFWSHGPSNENVSGCDFTFRPWLQVSRKFLILVFKVLERLHGSGFEHAPNVVAW